MHPHTFGTLGEPPAQLRGAVQVPQLTVRVVPQLSVTVIEPQFFPAVEQSCGSVWGVQQLLGDGALAPSQTWPVPQVPQLVTVRLAPQLSVAITEPHVLPSRVQNAELLSATQPHTPLPPQVCGAVQVPQLVIVRVVPQLSAAVTEPQFLTRREHICVSLSGVQQTLGEVAGDCAQTWLPVQAEVPQSTEAPQLSLTTPHLPEQVTDIALRVHPQMFAVTAPHACPLPVPHVALPQVSVPPQPSLSVPHCACSSSQVVGVHVLQW